MVKTTSLIFPVWKVNMVAVPHFEGEYLLNQSYISYIRKASAYLQL